ncbi:Cys/Met metabolism PLP-dependent enzyme-domain-containing protein [Colletotrichum phormii]|uniref:Cys/Met metabolism PLP-dependent enzyme-domain-containing protein n=1 Tax=Colletotrichum phormii TaxID=359342 RepID=A0AAI9ZJU7_9PEZI|nr:Cys/Met metabolism PLP-dependent enzyme-domain-containing protein [Colletotrichum phormii]KAK1624880.1 Cys/Met metabolism PLP-dependent enzyme-domain-containing protein [Colletotrichum phormii]
MEPNTQNRGRDVLVNHTVQKRSKHIPKFETLQVHAGQTPDSATLARGVPIYSTYVFNFHSSAHAARLFNLEEEGEIATRTGNPTTAVVERRVAALEGGVAAVAVSSGQAAVFMTMVALAGHGENIVATKHYYHGAYNQFSFLLPEFGFVLGIETLSLRCERHAQNTIALANWLEKNENVVWVSYPGLPSHPHYKLAQKHLPRGAGAVLMFGIKGGADAGEQLVDNFKMISNNPGYGDAKTTAMHPWSTTHRPMLPQEKIDLGVAPEMVRVSVGIEHIDDIIHDIEEIAGITIVIKVVYVVGSLAESCYSIRKELDYLVNEM